MPSAARATLAVVHGEVSPFNDGDNSPHWQKDQGKINRNGENTWPSGFLSFGATADLPFRQAEAPDRVGEEHTVLYWHEPDLSQEMCLLLILRENTRLWHEVTEEG